MESDRKQPNHLRSGSNLTDRISKIQMDSARFEQISQRVNYDFKLNKLK